MANVSHSGHHGAGATLQYARLAHRCDVFAASQAPGPLDTGTLSNMAQLGGSGWEALEQYEGPSGTPQTGRSAQERTQPRQGRCPRSSAIPKGVSQISPWFCSSSTGGRLELPRYLAGERCELRMECVLWYLAGERCSAEEKHGVCGSTTWLSEMLGNACSWIYTTARLQGGVAPSKGRAKPTSQVKPKCGVAR